MIDSPEAFPVLASRTSENRSLVVMTNDACISIVFVFAFASVFVFVFAFASVFVFVFVCI